MSKIFVISAPSGTGKGTVIAELLKRDENLYYSVSMTTRSPRAGEENGVSYHFVTRETFLEKLKNNEILEYTEYCDNFYGTPLDILEQKMSEGKNCLLEIDVVGAENIRKMRKDAVLLFIAPPSMEELERRLRKRGTETDEVIAKRLAAANSEMEKQSLFDYVVINGELEKAVNDIENIIKKEATK
ncbi:MAG: guanylate kinase [Clostridia bacterium]|nr:guanylate kinase [Clostridia bacterium]